MVAESSLDVWWSRRWAVTLSLLLGGVLVSQLGGLGSTGRQTFYIYTFALVLLTTSFLYGRYGPVGLMALDFGDELVEDDAAVAADIPPLVPGFVPEGAVAPGLPPSQAPLPPAVGSNSLDVFAAFASGVAGLDHFTSLGAPHGAQQLPFRPAPAAPVVDAPGLYAPLYTQAVSA